MADFIKLSDLLNQVDWNTVTEDAGFEDLPEGFYLCEVEKAELKENKNQTNMQVSLQYKVVEAGLAEAIDDRGNSVLREIPGTLNRKVFKHYPFKDTAGIKRFVIDMIKFEGDVPGEPILGPEYFTTEETFPDALACLIGCRIYIQASYKEYQGKKNCWYDVVAWDRAKKMGLPC